VRAKTLRWGNQISGGGGSDEGKNVPKLGPSWVPDKATCAPEKAGGGKGECYGRGGTHQLLVLHPWRDRLFQEDLKEGEGPDREGGVATKETIFDLGTSRSTPLDPVSIKPTLFVSTKEWGGRGGKRKEWGGGGDTASERPGPGRRGGVS